MSKSMSDIILETLRYYGEAPAKRRGIKTTTYMHTDSYSGEVTERTRSVCDYVVENGETKYCAIGRCLTDDAKAWAKSHSGGVGEIVSEWWDNFWARDEWDNANEPEDFFVHNENQEPYENQHVYLDDMLLEEYRGHEVEFWERLQGLHDESKFWDGGDELWITMDGYHEVADMADQFLADNEERAMLMAGLQLHTEEFQP